MSVNIYIYVLLICNDYWYAYLHVYIYIVNMQWLLICIFTCVYIYIYICYMCMYIYIYMYCYILVYNDYTNIITNGPNFFQMFLRSGGVVGVCLDVLYAFAEGNSGRFPWLPNMDLSKRMLPLDGESAFSLVKVPLDPGVYTAPFSDTVRIASPNQPADEA